MKIPERHAKKRLKIWNCHTNYIIFAHRTEESALKDKKVLLKSSRDSNLANL